jgi:hypothetical protein
LTIEALEDCGKLGTEIGEILKKCDKITFGTIHLAMTDEHKAAGRISARLAEKREAFEAGYKTAKKDLKKAERD